MKKFEIIWRINHASLECKTGVHSIEETNATEEKGFLFNETMYGQIVDFDQLQKLTHYSFVYNFVMNEFTGLFDGEEIEASEFAEYLESVYDNETVKFYERKKVMTGGNTYKVYHPINEGEELTVDQFEIAKNCLDFTGLIIERSGTLASSY